MTSREIHYHVFIMKEGRMVGESAMSSPTLPVKGNTFEIDPYSGPDLAEWRNTVRPHNWNDDLNELAVERISFHEKHKGKYIVSDVVDRACVHFGFSRTDGTVYHPDFNAGTNFPPSRVETRTIPAVWLVPLEEVKRQEGEK